METYLRGMGTAERGARARVWYVISPLEGCFFTKRDILGKVISLQFLSVHVENETRISADLNVKRSGIGDGLEVKDVSIVSCSRGIIRELVSSGPVGVIVVCYLPVSRPKLLIVVLPIDLFRKRGH